MQRSSIDLRCSIPGVRDRHFSAVRRHACERAVMWSYLLSDLAPAAAGARSLHILDKSTFREGVNLIATDDKMIKYAHVYQCESILYASCDKFIRLRRRLGSRRVIVG